METNLDRFLKAQERDYPAALREITNGRKQSHWMWYIFPQLRGLGRSSTSEFYGIHDLDEATAYLKHPILGPRLIEICQVLNRLDNDNARSIFGSPDDLKLKSSLSLFASVEDADLIFNELLKKFFENNKDQRTLKLIDREF